MSVLLKMSKRAFGSVDRNVREIRASNRLELGVEVGEVAALEQGIVGEVDSGRNILRHEGDLFRLCKEIVGHAVEHEPADGDRRKRLPRG